MALYLVDSDILINAPREALGYLKSLIEEGMNIDNYEDVKYIFRTTLGMIISDYRKYENTWSECEYNFPNNQAVKGILDGVEKRDFTTYSDMVNGIVMLQINYIVELKKHLDSYDRVLTGGLEVDVNDIKDKLKSDLTRYIIIKYPTKPLFNIKLNEYLSIVDLSLSSKVPMNIGYDVFINQFIKEGYEDILNDKVKKLRRIYKQCKKFVESSLSEVTPDVEKKRRDILNDINKKIEIVSYGDTVNGIVSDFNGKVHVDEFSEKIVYFNPNVDNDDYLNIKRREFEKVYKHVINLTRVNLERFEKSHNELIKMSQSSEMVDLNKYKRLVATFILSQAKNDEEWWELEKRYYDYIGVVELCIKNQYPLELNVYR